MIEIYLCEDDKEQLASWKKIIENYLLMSDMEIELSCCASNPKMLLDTRKKSNKTGLYFLDIDLQNKQNGLELAQEIRKLDPRGYIVFVTTHDEMLPLTFHYKVEAMYFISKGSQGDVKEKIFACICTAYENYKRQLHASDRMLSFKFNRTSFVIDQRDIVAFTVKDCHSHKLMLHTTTGVREIRGGIKEIMPSLGPTFCQCSRSLIINLTHLSSYSPIDYTLNMDNKEVYPVAYRMRGKLQLALKNFNLLRA